MNKRLFLEKLLEVAGEAGEIAMSLRDNPTVLDWIAVGSRSMALGNKVSEGIRMTNYKDPYGCFVVKNGWRSVSNVLGAVILQNVTDIRMDASYKLKTKVFFGDFFGTTVGWLSDEPSSMPLDQPREVDLGPYVHTSDKAAVYKAARPILWESIGSRHALLSDDGVCVDMIGQEEHPRVSSLFSEKADRCQKFVDAGVTRSILFYGPPGTGKSVGIRQIGSKLGLMSLRLTVKDCMDINLSDATEVLQVLRPGVVILDDIDRVRDDSELLTFLEVVRDYCKLMLCSANDTTLLTGAVRRPGRFDEMVEVNCPGSALVYQMLETAGLPDYAGTVNGQALLKVPVAFIKEFLSRYNVIGLEAAEKELPALLGRV